MAEQGIAGKSDAGVYTLGVRLRVFGGGTLVYGTGVSALLRQCAKTGSLNTAARQMGLSYRKALTMVKRAEHGFGQPILEKTIGGAGGGGSRLNAFGHTLVEQFALVEDEVAAYAAERLRARLPGIRLAP